MRIGIANYSTIENIRKIVCSAPNREVAWLARNGAEAVEKCARDTPDLVLMDLHMPVMDGMEATRRIMQESPCPILMTTAAVNENAAKVFEALGHGALDAVNTPLPGNDPSARQSKELLLKKINTIAKLCGCSFEKQRISVPEAAPRAVSAKVPPLVVIGSSTGGPKAVANVLSRLPADLKAAIIIVQHVDEEFSASLANWLDAQVPFCVCLAREGECAKSGNAYVAGTNDHLELTARLRFAYTPNPRTLPYRPSVDVFFKSVAKHWPDKGEAILLTGMGKDGAQGLAALRRTGWHTIAQDKASSVVYGMPKEAKRLGAAREILSLEKIGPAILKFLG
ncbi:MAG: chemotaxis response regulator protein-glutamate methylesterase [Gammaproteobacteria bacterium]|nr:chemotaxis response regulator protein-glutamate methylesterase [Gammaproteobacteria bacterium]